MSSNSEAVTPDGALTEANENGLMDGEYARVLSPNEALPAPVGKITCCFKASYLNASSQMHRRFKPFSENTKTC